MTSNAIKDEQDHIGKYAIIQNIYPNTDTLSQFRICKVAQKSLENPQILVQRIVFGEFESFDDCYTVTKYLDGQKNQLKDFFLTHEYDGKIRLNHVFDEHEPFSKGSDGYLFRLLKNSVKELNKLKLNGMLVSEMQPDVMRVHGMDVQYLTVITKNNLPSVFCDRFVGFIGNAEYFDQKMLQGKEQGQYQN